MSEARDALVTEQVALIKTLAHFEEVQWWSEKIDGSRGIYIIRANLIVAFDTIRKPDGAVVCDPLDHALGELRYLYGFLSNKLHERDQEHADEERAHKARRLTEELHSILRDKAKEKRSKT